MRLTLYLKRAVCLAFLSLSALAASAQTSFFEPVPTAQLRIGADQNPHIRKLAYYRLKETNLRTFLAKAPVEFTNRGPAIALQIPLPDGTVETFDMLESPILAPAIAAKHPEIKTYNGQGQIHKNYTIRISFTALGFNAIILGVNGDAVYYDKVSTNRTDQLYRTYFARDAERPTPANSSGKSLNTKCGTDDSRALPIKTQPTNNGARATQVSTGTVLRNFRLAVAADGEFTNLPAYGGNVNAAFAGLVSYVNRMNAVYRVELSVQLNLVSDVTAVYSNTATDPYTNSNQGKMLDENQANLDKLVGKANYDVGHVLGTAQGSGGGVAVFQSLCDNDIKGQGVTGIGDGSFAPVFNDQTLTHEMGHQFGMSHSYNSSIPVCTTRNPGTSVEPGSGATIMSYGFTCDTDTKSDNYEQPAYGPILTFHTVNYDQAQAHITNSACFTTSDLDNVAPVVVVPANRTIPKSTPFTLTGSASDADGNPLTYSWEGTNVGTIVPTQTTLDNTAQPPFFRTYQPTSTGTRTFPRLEAILSGTNQAKGDKLPSVGIVTTHRLTVRDGLGGLAYEQMTVTIDANSGPFLETTNLKGSYLQNTAQTITWSVANTNSAPVNCATVNILLSTDGGLTFPTTLAANTPNDGSQSITLPAIDTDQARIKIASSNNIFFDISNANFSIVNPANQKPLAVTLATDKMTTSTAGPVVLTASVSGGRAPYTYKFLSEGGYSDISSADSPIITLTDLSTGVQTFTVTVVDNSFPISQTATGLVSFTVEAVPSVGLTAPDSVVTAGTGNNGGGKVVRRRSGSVAAAGDDGADYAIFHFARSNADGPLTVQYSISGSAVGNTLLMFDGDEVFEDGEMDFDLYVYPGDDLLQNGDQTLTLTLIDEEDYDVLPQDDDATIYFRTGSFSITGVTTVSCTPVSGDANRRSLTFTPQYSGADGQPISFSVVNELAPTTDPGPYTLSLYTDNPIITLKATQSETPGEASFAYNWLAACNGDVITPPSSPFSITAVTTVSCQTLSVGQRRLSFTPQYVGLNGGPVSFSVINELSPTTASGPYMLDLYTDNPIINLRATQSGTQGEAAFSYNWLAACTGTAPEPPSGAFSITAVTTISCQTLSAGQRQISFTPRYAGLSGGPVSFSVVNELLPTTASGPYTLNLYTDNPVITLKATQSGTPAEAIFSYGWLAACNSSAAARLGADASGLSVRVMGNPTQNGQVLIEVQGVSGQSVQMNLSDVQGRLIGSHRVDQAGSLERHTFEINRQPVGVLVLRVSTATQSQTVNVVKAN